MFILHTIRQQFYRRIENAVHTVTQLDRHVVPGGVNWLLDLQFDSPLQLIHVRNSAWLPRRLVPHESKFHGSSFLVASS